jgi:hypothetical protein
MRSMEEMDGDAWPFSTCDMKLGENPVFSARLRNDKRCCSRRRLIAGPSLSSDISTYGTKQHKDFRAKPVAYSADEHMISSTGQLPRKMTQNNFYHSNERRGIQVTGKTTCQILQLSSDYFVMRFSGESLRRKLP